MENEKPKLLERPVVTIEWSEHEAFKADQRYTIAEIDEKVKKLDREVVQLKQDAIEKGEYYPYFKTKFKIDFATDGENQTYNGRQDIGGGDGGIIDHLKSVARGFLDINGLLGGQNLKELGEMVLTKFVPFLEEQKKFEISEKMILETKSKLDMLQELKKFIQPGRLNDELDINGLYKEPRVKIHWSEVVDKEFFKQDEIIPFSEANSRFRLAETEIRMLKEMADINKQYYQYIKTKFDLMVSPDKSIGMRYDIGDGYAEELIDFCNKELKNNLEHADLLRTINRIEVATGIFVLDDNDEVKLVTGVSEEIYEGFKVRPNANLGITDVKLTCDKDINTSLTANLETKHKLKKENIKSIIGTVKSDTMSKILKHKGLFQSKNLIKEYKSSLEVSLENKLSDGLDFFYEKIKFNINWSIERKE